MKIVDGISDEWCGEHYRFDVRSAVPSSKNKETDEIDPNLIYVEDTIIDITDDEYTIITVNKKIIINDYIIID